MKKFVLAAAATALLSGTTFAADLGVISQPAPAAYIPVSDWNGFYAGIFGGVANGPFDYSVVPAGSPSILDVTVNGGGFLGGAQIGYDVQFDQFVLGAVTDIAVTNHRADLSMSAPGGGMDANATSRLTYLGTIRARAGYAFDDLLAYVHGGVAYGRTETEVVVNGVAAPGILNNDRWGYTVGAGVEYKVTENVSLQTEYSFTRFDARDVYNVGGDAITEALGIHAVKAGINFRF